jgi:hypothetical protein
MNRALDWNTNKLYCTVYMCGLHNIQLLVDSTDKSGYFFSLEPEKNAFFSPCQARMNSGKPLLLLLPGLSNLG